VSRSLLDTSVLIGGGTDRIPGELAISAVSLAELNFSVLVARSDEVRAHRLGRLTTLSRLFDALPVDEAVADSYGRLAARVAQHGRQPRARVMDLLIAATAHAHSATLYTRNAADLRGLENLLHIAAV
jgi:predicted nucleic acid-binding protein